MSRILFIRNPAAFGGSGPAAWESFQEQWPDPIDPQDVLVTQRPGHAREIAVAAEDYDILAAVGGDGTAGEILSGIMEHPEPRPKLATIPGGTGNDIARNAGIFSVPDAVNALRGGQGRVFDIIRIDCQFDGRPAYRYALLNGVAGFSAQPMIRPWMKRLLGPKGAYYLGTMMQIIAYRSPHMTVRWEEGEHSGRTIMVIIGNTERASGGSMCLAPGALSDDGELNVTIIPVMSKFTMIFKMFPKIPSGEYVNGPGVQYFPAKNIEVTSDPPALLDIDGDLFGTTPAMFTVHPLALEILSPGPSET
jgi:YegS/Rv2252/BmrU family lipid kinase